MTVKHPYGEDYARKISRAKAQIYCRMFSLPNMGCETMVAATRAGRLYVQNISGQFFLASPFVPVIHWEAEFKVKA